MVSPYPTESPHSEVLKEQDSQSAGTVETSQQGCTAFLWESGCGESKVTQHISLPESEKTTKRVSVTPRLLSLGACLSQDGSCLVNLLQLSSPQSPHLKSLSPLICQRVAR